MNECELMKNIWQLQPMSFMGYCVNIHIIQHEESDKHDYTQVCSQKKCLFQEILENAGKEML